MKLLHGGVHGAKLKKGAKQSQIVPRSPNYPLRCFKKKRGVGSLAPSFSWSGVLGVGGVWRDNAGAGQSQTPTEF